MWKFNKATALLCALWLLPALAISQICTWAISGVVSDETTGEPMAFANVFVRELKTGAITDSLGTFRIESVCSGNYHLTVSHIGCEPKEFFLPVNGDTTVFVLMDHHSQLLHEVTISAEAGSITTQENLSLAAQRITEYADKSLGNVLENLSGVSSLRTGSGIATPVIHGLFGNRITILNNGIAQSGQQWGADHAPEIDPLAAQRITVVKGAGAMEYPGNSLGGVIRIDPGSIPNDPHLHGSGRYFFESNGLGNGVHLRLQQHTDIVAWRISGTLKKTGDKHTPDYFLRNTGNEEAHLAIQLEKTINRWKTDLYFSTFNARMGVLRGSHIGNLNDLTDAMQREVPFFTEEKFSYSIDAPHQSVNHHLLKLHTQYRINNSSQFDLTYAAQYNRRKEFDIRRGDRSDIPALSLEQFNHFAEGSFETYFTQNTKLKTGLQFNRTHNTNVPETGILPLIPDYIANAYGAFLTMRQTMNRTTIELGGRYDFEERWVAAISTTLPREVMRYQQSFHTGGAIAGVSYEFNPKWTAAYNIGLAMRNPEVNELFSNGLHQGVSGIEEGDPNLESELSLKQTFSVKGNIGDRVLVHALFYHQLISDYIYLQPQDQMRLTIRGAFPVFRYEQTEARLAGFDLAASWQITRRFKFNATYSFLDGHDRSQDIPLVYMPANNLLGALEYQFPKLWIFQNVELQLNNRYVFEQTNLLATQDFMAPPKDYHLTGIRLSAEKQLSKLRLTVYARAENLLNVRYRDYLNRQRYYADEPGINIIAGINLTF